MRRIAVGLTVGLAVWFGSAVAAEAQWIQPTGPLLVYAGTSSTTYTATITIPTPMGMCVKLWVLKNGIEYNYTSNSIPNPGTTTYYFSKFVDTSTWNLAAGDVLTFRAQLLYNRTIYNFADYNITVQQTRPSRTYQKSPKPALQVVDRDRRRE
jgi:hypothetical protein